MSLEIPRTVTVYGTSSTTSKFGGLENKETLSTKAVVYQSLTTQEFEERKVAAIDDLNWI